MPNKNLRIFFIGDIIGRYGRKFLDEVLPHLKKKYNPDVVVANGENLAGGLGLTKKTAEEIILSGVNVVTTGNHIWDKKESIELLEKEEFVIRPLNFPQSAPGRGFCEYKIAENLILTVVNLQGRVFMEPVVDNPFLAIKEWLRNRRSKIILLDFHAEASAEKQAMGFYLNGKVSAVLGSHTHVPSADIRILSNGTAYQTDVGMTGSLDSIIGMKKQPIITKFLTGINQRFEVAKKDLILDLAIIDVDKSTGRATQAESLRLHESNYRKQL